MDLPRRVLPLVQEYSLPLIIGVFAGLVFGNLDQHLYHELVEFHPLGEHTAIFGHPFTIHFLVNGVFMVFFFGIAAKEITDSVLPGGALNPIRTAINPLMGTLGGVFGPAGLYLLLAYVFYGGGENFSVVANGWAIPTATDIALAWLVARLVFGQGHPAVNFLLLLAVADDAIGLGIIAIFYPDPHLPVKPEWLLLTAAGMGVAWGMRRLHVRSWIPYIAVAGVLSWLGMAIAHIETALGLVPIVPFLPSNADGANAARTDSGSMAEHYETHAHSTLEQFEHQLKLPVDFGLFFFAFANAGVTFGAINEGNAHRAGIADRGKDGGDSLVFHRRNMGGVSASPRHERTAPGGGRADSRDGADGGPVRSRQGIHRTTLPGTGEDGGAPQRADRIPGPGTGGGAEGQGWRGRAYGTGQGRRGLDLG